MFFFSLASALTDANIDSSQYSLTRQLSERLMLHVRIIGVSPQLYCV